MNENPENQKEIEEDEEGEQEGEKEEGEDVMKKSVANLNLDICEIVDKINSPYDLHKFDMNKTLESYDEINQVKRKSRNKEELAIIRPWQNLIMAKFMDFLLADSKQGYLVKTSMIKNFAEAGVPLSLNRLGLCKPFYERKSVFPPWAPNK